MKRYALVTLFPEMTAALTSYGVSGRAFKRGICQLDCVNPRDFAEDRHKTVDDKPYGGGPGMVMAYPPLARALEEAKARTQTGAESAKVVYLSPQGRPLTHDIVEELAAANSLVLLSGRYEGIDERVIEDYVDDEISIGDFVVSGGELPAMLLLDAIIRLLPGAIGDSESTEQDSFAGRGMLDYPHYTRPELVGRLFESSLPESSPERESMDSKAVPDVLLSGDHKEIARWRAQQALFRTRDRRPDLLQRLIDQGLLSDEETHWLNQKK